MKKHKHLVHFFLVLLSLGILLIVTGCRRKPIALPNVVVVVIDTLRADHLPCYGYSLANAPFISRIASHGVVFEKAFAASSWTAPATASLFTSLYPFQHGVVMGLMATRNLQKRHVKIAINRIPDEIEILPEMFKKCGYRTFGVADNSNIHRVEGFTPGFDRFETLHNQGAVALNEQVKKWQADIRSATRYFLYLHYNDPHKPYLQHAPWYRQGENQLQNEISAYDSEIRVVDERIQELFSLFKWHENTLLIITADHGEEFREHGGSGHGKNLYREVLHVPLVFYFPPSARSSRRITAHVSTIDILPTLRQYVGLKHDRVAEGISLLPLIHGKSKRDSGRYLFSHLQVKIANAPDQIAIATIADDWKFIRNQSGGKELFFIKKDFGEQHNQAFDQAYERIASRLEGRYLAFSTRCRKFKQQLVDYTLDKKKLDELRSLGYVQ